MTETIAVSAAEGFGSRFPITRLDGPLAELLDDLCTPQVRTTKEGAGWWSPILWRGDKRKAENAESVGLLVYDLDVDEDPSFDLDALRDLPWAHCVFETWTPGRYRLVLPLTAPIHPNDYEGCWRACLVDLKIGHWIDKSRKDLASVYFFTGSSDGSPRQSFTRLDLPFYTAHKGKSILPPPTENHKIFDLDKVRTAIGNMRPGEKRTMLMQAVDGTLVLKEGERNNTIHQLMSTLGFLTVDGKGIDTDLAMAILEPTLAKLEPDEDWRKTARSSYERARVSHGQKEQAKAKVNEFFTPKAPDENWRAQLLMQEVKGILRPENHTQNLELILANDDAFKGSVRWNVLTRAVNVLGGVLKGMPEETLPTALSNYFTAAPWNARFTRDTCSEALLHRAMQTPFDPVRQYLDNLPEWDGVKRIDSLLFDHANAKGNRKFIEKITRKFLVSAVARALDPGCQADSMLVLQGGQGTGKTSFVRELAAGFSVETKISLDSKDAVMTATGNWIVELAELASLKGSEVEAMRAFLSNRADQIRLPYGRAISTFKRRCVFIGTTNSRQPLVDPEGNRRFWVVHVGAVDIPWVREHRDQLWAEARMAYEAGESWWLEGADVEMAKAEASVWEVDDPYVEALAQGIDATKIKPYFLTAYDAGTRFLGLELYQISPPVMLKINKALQKLGWVARRPRIQGIQRRGYCNPQHPDFQKNLTDEEMEFIVDAEGEAQ